MWRYFERVADCRRGRMRRPSQNGVRKARWDNRHRVVIDVCPKPKGALNLTPKDPSVEAPSHSGDKPGAFQMASTLDLQKRCEQRWAARFSRPAEPIVALKHRIERQDQELAATGEAAEASPGRRPDPDLVAA
jgi:hypothetical protein